MFLKTDPRLRGVEKGGMTEHERYGETESVTPRGKKQAEMISNPISNGRSEEGLIG